MPIILQNSMSILGTPFESTSPHSCHSFFRAIDTNTWTQPRTLRLGLASEAQHLEARKDWAVVPGVYHDLPPYPQGHSDLQYNVCIYYYMSCLYFDMRFLSACCRVGFLTRNSSLPGSVDTGIPLFDDMALSGQFSFLHLKCQETLFWYSVSIYPSGPCFKYLAKIVRR